MVAIYQGTFAPRLLSGCSKEAGRIVVFVVALSFCSICGYSAEPVSGAGKLALPPSQAFNYVVTTIFALAILHTFFAAKFMQIAHRLGHEHRERMTNKASAEGSEAGHGRGEVSFKAELFHFLGEIEVVFGLWVVPLLLAMLWFYGWGTGVTYL